MSVWGTKPFENDDAADWATELAEKPRLASIEDAIDEITGSPDTGYFEIPECCIAIAAAQVLSEVFGAPDNQSLLEEDALAALKSDLDKIGARKKQKLLKKAAAAIEFIMDDEENSELRQVLEEDKDDFDAWTANVKHLKNRLSEIAMQVSN